MDSMKAGLVPQLDADPANLTADQLPDLLNECDRMEESIQRIRERAKELILSGQTVPGWRVSDVRRQSIIDHEGAFATVMAVSGGYPGDYQKGFPITGIELVTKETKTTLFQAGTGFKDDVIVTNGGRVLTVTAQGNTISEAVDSSKKALALIQFEGMNFRTDIGYEFKA